MSAPQTPEQRAAYISGMRALMDLLEARPDLPLPWAGSSYPFSLDFPYGQDRPMLAAWEQALQVPLTAHIRNSGSEDDDDTGTWYDLDGQLHGLKVRIRAYRDRVAEKRVTGTRTIETVEWVRLPAEPEESPADESSEEDEAR